MRPILRPVMPELHSLRGLACLAVLFFHGLWWYIPASAMGLAGWLRDLTAEWHRGVGFFFVLSGLLITGILRDSRERPDYFVRFYKRRALRILPAYYLMLILLWLFGERVTPQFLGLSAIYLANMAPLLGIVMAYGPLWTLAVEEQFYLFWPAFIRHFSNRMVVFLSVSLFAYSLLLTVGLHTTAPKAVFPLWYAAHSLALGDLLALFLRWERVTRMKVWNLAAALAIAGFGSLWLSHWDWRRPQVPIMVKGMGYDFLFASVLLFAVLVGSSRYERFLRPKVLQFFGEISYGLYLVHVLVFMVYRRMVHPGDDLHSILRQFVVCSAVSILLATASRFTVEAWFLGLKDKPLRFWRNQVTSEESTVCAVTDG